MIVQDRMVGDVRVTRVEEIIGPLIEPRVWCIDFNEAELAAHPDLLTDAFYDTPSGNLIVSIHSWILRTQRQTILIDSCFGNQKVRPGLPAGHMLNSGYLNRLRAADVGPEDVDVVLCTHLHSDHIGWNTRLENGRWRPTFPNAKYVMSRRDHDDLSSAAQRIETVEANRNAYEDSVLPVVAAGLAVLVGGTEELDAGLRLRPSPGHSAGHMQLDLESRGHRAVFAGDVVHHPVQVPLWRWRTRSCADPNLARETRRRVLAECAELGSLLMPAHFPYPHCGTIQAHGDEFSISF